MNIQQISWEKENGWDTKTGLQSSSNLVFVFADTDYFYEEGCYQDLASFYPKADIIGCSSSGNIRNTKVSDNNLTVLALQFKKSWIKSIGIDHDSSSNIADEIQQALKDFPRENLRHCFILCDGLNVNSTDLAESLSINVNHISITGGLAGDADRFAKTGTMFNGTTKKNQVVIIGFYGAVQITSGFSTGWTEFGAERRITRSIKNTVYELDHEPALDIYERYLGEQAVDLPSSGLRFPLSMRRTADESPIIRTLLGINREERSLTFAGDMPEASFARLMKTNIDSLLESSQEKISALKSQHQNNQGLCLIVSCVGRRHVLDQISEEEMELLAAELGSEFKISGFYSYGEFASYNLQSCQLHNQTSTITLISEDE
jgi:hypothetical protein